MADLKYFIRESQRFRAEAGNVEGGMIGERGSLCISALWSNNGQNVVQFRKRQQNGIKKRMTGCALVFIDEPSNAIELSYYSR